MDSIRISCPTCGQHYSAPLARVGSNGKCGKCGSRFQLQETGAVLVVPTEVPAATPPLGSRTLTPVYSADDPVAPLQAAPVAQAMHACPACAEQIPRSAAKCPLCGELTRLRRTHAQDDAAAGGGSFGIEREGVRHGVVGGLVMMAIAAVWFFGGLAAGYIFFYPPVLFVIGVYAFLKGLVTGNVAGEASTRSPIRRRPSLGRHL